jgi:hypothetical protein
MSDWINKLIQEWPAIRAAPWSFTLALVLALVIFIPMIWLVINWSYSAVLAAKDSQILSRGDEIKFVERQRDDYKEKLSGASPDQAKSLIADLRAEVDKLKKQIQERDIDQDTAREIVAELKRHPMHEISITYATGDKGSERYADKISNVLRDGGWNVRGPRAETYLGGVFDLSILVGSKADGDGADLVASIFERHGVTIDVHPTNREDQFDLIVGRPSR